MKALSLNFVLDKSFPLKITVFAVFSQLFGTILE